MLKSCQNFGDDSPCVGSLGQEEWSTLYRAPQMHAESGAWLEVSCMIEFLQVLCECKACCGLYWTKPTRLGNTPWLLA